MSETIIQKVKREIIEEETCLYNGNKEINFFISDKDKIPTIHFHGKNFKCSLRLDKPEYVNSYEGEKETNDIDFLISFLKEKNPEFEIFTNYEIARKCWNLSYSGRDYPVPLIKMPNYNLILKEK